MTLQSDDTYFYIFFQISRELHQSKNICRMFRSIKIISALTNSSYSKSYVLFCLSLLVEFINRTSISQCIQKGVCRLLNARIYLPPFFSLSTLLSAGKFKTRLITMFQIISLKTQLSEFKRGETVCKKKMAKIINKKRGPNITVFPIMFPLIVYKKNIVLSLYTCNDN